MAAFNCQRKKEQMEIHCKEQNSETQNSTRMPELEDLAEQIGEFIHYWGFKRVHGRIWTHLYLANRPLDAADLVQQMKISKALVSISIRELLEYEVIEEVGKSPRGTHLYRNNPDILKVILSVLRKREKRIIARVQAAQLSLERTPELVRADAGLSAESVHRLGELINNASIGLESFIAFKSVDFGDWRKSFITTDLAKEAKLRADATSAESQPSETETLGTPKLSLHASLRTSDLADSHASDTHMAHMSYRRASDSAPVLSSGKGIGFRLY